MMFCIQEWALLGGVERKNQSGNQNRIMCEEERNVKNGTTEKRRLKRERVTMRLGEIEFDVLNFV